MSKTIKRRGFLAAGTALMTSFAGCATEFPDYETSLLINNQTEVSQTVETTITHVGSDEIVHNATHSVDGNSVKSVFDFEEIKDQYRWIEDFEIEARTENDNDRLVYTTDKCHSSPEVMIYEEGIGFRYAIC